MNWLCRLGWHDPAGPVHWEAGYYVGRCRRCGRDLLRSFRGRWKVPSDVVVRRHGATIEEEGAAPPAAPASAAAPEPPLAPARGEAEAVSAMIPGAAASAPVGQEARVIARGASERGLPEESAHPQASAAPASPCEPPTERVAGRLAPGARRGALLLVVGLIAGALLTLSEVRLLSLRQPRAPATAPPPPQASAPPHILPQAAPPVQAAPLPATLVALHGEACRAARRQRWARSRDPRQVQVRIEEEDGHWLTLTGAGTPCWVLVSGRRR